MVSGVVASLVQRVLWSMTMIKISGVAAGVVLVGLAGYGVGTAAQQAGQPQPCARVGQVLTTNAGRRSTPAARVPTQQESRTRIERHAMDVSFVHSQVDGEATVISIRSPGCS